MNKQTPMYVVGKMLAILGGLYALWQNGFLFDASTAGTMDKASAGLVLGAVASLFEHTPWVNTLLGAITKLVGIPYQPDVTEPSAVPPPPPTV